MSKHEQLKRRMLRAYASLVKAGKAGKAHAMRFAWLDWANQWWGHY